MTHYLYLLEFNDGMKYIGARSTVLHDAALDVHYLGSGRALPKRSINTVKKHILRTYDTREELMNAELTYIYLHDCVNSSRYYNMRHRTYDRHGDVCPNSGKHLIGRTAATHSYIATAVTKRKRYVGKNRTPAQKAHDKRMRGVSLGPNPKKGKAKTKNSCFRPWYCISPDGLYHEFRNTMREDFAIRHGRTRRQITHRFHYSNIDKEAKVKPWKGWTFGYLDTRDKK